ncbi:MAG: hypothetical protein WBA16_09335 [Nonlabens sp.]
MIKIRFEDQPIIFKEPFKIIIENLGKIDGSLQFLDSNRWDYIRPAITVEKSKYYNSVSFVPSPIGSDLPTRKFNYKNMNVPGFLTTDQPYTLNYRLCYK